MLRSRQQQGQGTWQMDPSRIPALTLVMHFDIHIFIAKLCVANKGGLSIGDFATQYKYKNTQVDAKVDIESNILTTITVTDLPAFLIAIALFKYPDYNSGKLESQYLHQHADITAAVGLKQSPGIHFSASFGTPNIAFGLETTYLTGCGEFAKYNAGVSLTKQHITHQSFFVLFLTNKFYCI